MLHKPNCDLHCLASKLSICDTKLQVNITSLAVMFLGLKALCLCHIMSVQEGSEILKMGQT